MGSCRSYLITRNEFSDRNSRGYRLVLNVVTAFEYHILTKLVGACMAGLTCLMLVRAWRRKKKWGWGGVGRGANLLGGTLCGEGVTIEVRRDMGGTIILTGKSQRENIIWWHRS